ELDLAVRRKLLIAGTQGGLNFGGTADGFDRTGELRQDGVAGGVENPPMVQIDQSTKCLAMVPEYPERLLLVFRHQAAVLGNVGGQYRYQLAFDHRRRKLILQRALPSQLAGAGCLQEAARSNGNRSRAVRSAGA